MKSRLYCVVTSLIGASSVIVLSASYSFAQDSYFSTAPTPLAVPQYKGTQLLASSAKGTNFYSVTPFYSAQTRDGNLFVTSIVLMQDRHRSTMGTYIQIDCGRSQYRDLIPWVVMDRLGEVDFSSPVTYNWRYFRANSAFETVGKSLCDIAAHDPRLRI
jgi:hypothetical protein